jgi:pyruvate dehydrogenase E2 component (dihydrolipoamide acetyltransferase)
MATEVKLPEIAEGVDKGDVLSLLVKVGDNIEVDTPLLELESEKATVPIPSPIKGKITKILVKPGQKVSVGQSLIEVDSPNAKAASETTSKEPAATAKREVKRTTEKTTEDKASEAKQAKPETQPQAGKPRQQTPANAPAPLSPAPGGPIPAGPAVRRIAREIGIDLHEIRGSGRFGRILVEDLDPYIKQYVQRNGGASSPAPAIPRIELPDFSKWGKIRRVKADNLRRKISEHVTQGWMNIPHVHHFGEADVTDLLALQKRHKERVKNLGGTLTLTPFNMKAVAIALKEFPKVNSTLDPDTNEFIFKEYYHIGMAVDTEGGLLVPVVRDVDKKPILQLSIELQQIAELTRDRRVAIEDMRGGTFTISNLGSIGGGIFTPIINAPETAILGVARALRKPLCKNDQFVPRDMLPLCLAYDHRVIDGADGARFMVRLIEILTNFEATFLGF